ncbi:MAG TPA: sulfotransferase domain-containing protein [Gaiellaceae bacterium]|nr:sulfotransferase domain-containing protein [Gaiellaceae bacterium]
MPRKLRKLRRRIRPGPRFRLATGRARILPSFLVLGAQRAGTTTLFDHLLRHPDVRGPHAGGDEVEWRRKEVHFFDERFWRGLDWYRSFFPLAASRRIARLRGGDLVAGEATPYYLFHPLVPERVAKTIPEVGLIALLRDPVERAYSHYQMMRRTGREKLSFAEALAAEEERLASAVELAAGEEEGAFGDDRRRRHHHHRHRAYFARGLYAEQLERWLAHFPREQLLVLLAEDLFARPSAVCEDVVAFLGLRPHDLTARSSRATTASPGRPWSKRQTRNRAAYEAISPEVRARLEQRYAEPNARLARLLGPEFAWGRASAGEQLAPGVETPGA